MNQSQQFGTKKDYQRMQVLQEYELLLRGEVEPKLNDPFLEKEGVKTREQYVQYRQKQILSEIRLARQGFHHVFYTLEDMTTDELNKTIRLYRQGRGRVPTDIDDPVFKQWRDYLKEAESALYDELADRDQNPKSSADPIKEVTSQVEMEIEIELSLQRAMDEKLKTYPEEYHDLIRRKYRRAIDALRDKQ